MALDSYSPCPCGSGKKFKWCCEPIYATIARAFDQEANGQHEAAARIMDDLVKEHGSNPEAWGKRAELLYHHGKIEEAEKSLEEAFKINPNYPWGLLLRGIVRFQEGEIPGALILARKAADAYDPAAHDYLARVYSLIFECEMSLNRPVAARAALRSVMRYDPADEELPKRFEAEFGKESRLPACAREDYKLQAPPASMSGARRAAWDAAFSSATPRLSDLAKAFEQLTKEDETDSAAWFNLGLTKAWLGDNKGALAALDRYLALENDDGRATTAATLQEVLRCGAGLEEEGDYQLHVFFHPLRDPEPINALLNGWGEAKRMFPQPSQQGTFSAMLLEHTTGGLITVGTPGAEVARVAGYLFIAAGLMQVSSPLKEPFDRLRDEVRTKLALGLDALPVRKAPIPFPYVTAEALALPLRPAAGGQSDEERITQHVQKYYEDTWLHRPRRVLNNNTPIDAAGHPLLKKKLRGVERFIQDCAAETIVGKYDFDRLRRKLGLIAGGAPAPAATESAAPAAKVGDIAAMGAADLSALKAEELSDEQLEQAYRVSQKLDALELASHFVKALLERPANKERPDRYPWYSFLVQQAVKDGRLDEALDLVNDGERVDCEQNEGRRRDDYELRRGQIHVKRGEADAAQDVFQRLIERVPSNFKYRGAAAEAMMALKQPGRAVKFAEEGLAAARQANDRDSEGYLMELAAAAKKQMG
jgi:tetratricopeptide (TPR) repeat protein